MRPREKDGVVDTHLKVYGTKNLRVVDLSVIPIHIAAHTQGELHSIIVTLAMLRLLFSSHCIRNC